MQSSLNNTNEFHTTIRDFLDTKEHNSDEEITTCKYYVHACTFIMPCCNESYHCRRCHDEENYNDQLNSDEKHKVDIKTITQMVCNNCETVQDIGNECITCKTVFGKYACLTCLIFDDVDKGQYHCNGCGLCRLGGQEHFFHCNTCNCCLNKELEKNHKCLTDRLNINCPICLDNMFGSTDKTCFLRCGHGMHNKCFAEYVKSNYKCPICLKSITDLTEYFKILEQEIADTPIPEELSKKDVEIFCNDCETESTVKFHIIGFKCGKCGSFNTRNL